jgi:hypothetical protein
MRCFNSVSFGRQYRGSQSRRGECREEIELHPCFELYKKPAFTTREGVNKPEDADVLH